MSLRTLTVPMRAAAVAALPLVLLAARADDPAPTRTLAPGVTYTFKVTGAGRSSTAMSGKGQMAGGNARIDIESGASGPMMGSGSSVIIRDGGRTMTITDPKEKKYFEMSSESMGSLFGAASALVKMDVSDVKTNVEKVGPGETLLGRKTVHYRMTQSYTMTMSMLGQKQTISTKSVSNSHVAQDLQRLMNPFLDASFGMRQMLGNSPGFQALMTQSEDAAKQMAGVPLKTVTEMTTTNPDGKVETNTMTMEITSIGRADIPDATFEVPAGYTKVEMPQLTGTPESGAAPSAADSAKGAGIPGAKDAKDIKDAAKEGAKQGATEAAKEGARKKVRGLFGRP